MGYWVHRYTTSYPLGTARGKAPTLAVFERDTSELSDNYTFDYDRKSGWLAVNNFTLEEDYYFDPEGSVWLPTSDDV